MEQFEIVTFYWVWQQMRISEHSIAFVDNVKKVRRFTRIYAEQLQQETNHKDHISLLIFSHMNQTSFDLYARLLFPFAKAKTFVETTEVAYMGNIIMKAFKYLSSSRARSAYCPA